MESIAGFFNSLKKETPIAWLLLIGMIYLSIEMRQIDHKLGNHITDTNKKIEYLTGRVDQLSDRFDRLYEVLIKSKK